jgi:hypothetical protein
LREKVFEGFGYGCRAAETNIGWSRGSKFPSVLMVWGLARLPAQVLAYLDARGDGVLVETLQGA